MELKSLGHARRRLIFGTLDFTSFLLPHIEDVRHLPPLNFAAYTGEAQEIPAISRCRRFKTLTFAGLSLRSQLKALTAIRFGVDKRLGFETKYLEINRCE
jgi:hypothetical protein